MNALPPHIPGREPRTNISSVMLASNYPVDKHMGTSPERLTAGLQSVLAHLDQAAREQICVRTAAKFYRIEL